MQVTKNMSKSNLVPAVDPMYETYESSVAPKGIRVYGDYSLETVSEYTIWDRFKYLRRSLSFVWKAQLVDLFKGKGICKDTFSRIRKPRLEIIRIFFLYMYRSFMYTPATTKYVRENKQRLSCNEKQVNQIAEGSLEWDDAACVLKYEQLEKLERTVLQKILNISKPTK